MSLESIMFFSVDLCKLIRIQQILFKLIQIEKVDTRSYKILVRSWYLNEIIQESDKKSSSLISYIKSYYIFF